MLTYKKDDFDESIEDIMESVNKIISKNQKKSEEQEENDDQLEKK